VLAGDSQSPAAMDKVRLLLLSSDQDNISGQHQPRF
jgi:hypothetical protein